MDDKIKALIQALSNENATQGGVSSPFFATLDQVDPYRLAAPAGQGVSLYPPNAAAANFPAGVDGYAGTPGGPSVFESANGIYPDLVGNRMAQQSAINNTAQNGLNGADITYMQNSPAHPSTAGAAGAQSGVPTGALSRLLQKYF